jgi:nitroreductase/NAD-dependent dihydropyrimidine dehydrogenase PreA subunit
MEDKHVGLFIVDQEKCNRDGLCVAACPMKIIEIKSAQGIPGPAHSAEELCIDCGHCVTICPNKALSHRSMLPEQCPPLRKDSIPDPDGLERLLRARRSIRNYKSKAVERETIGKLIRIARFAPSGHNVQPARWHVIYDTEEVRRLVAIVADWMRHMLSEEAPLAKALHMDRVVAGWEAGIDAICRGAPHVIVAHAPEQERTAPAACTIALAYLELAALSHGLGACWAGYFNTAANLWPPMLEALDLPEGHKTFGAMMLGHPKHKYQRLPLRNEPPITWR